MERHFNIAGPCVPGKHYMVPALERLPEVARLIDREQSFAIHAACDSSPPRGTQNQETKRTEATSRDIPLASLPFLFASVPFRHSLISRLMSRGRIPGARRWTRDAEKPATNHLTTHPPTKRKQPMKKLLTTIAAAIGIAVGSATALADSINLSEVTADTIVADGTTLTGTLGERVKISIADGATVTLDGVVINGANDEDCGWAGIICEGGATIILKGANTVKGFYEEYPGIYVPEGKTLTIKGDGSLDASSNGYGAGIGGGYNISCGNIAIEGGNIVATGGYLATGIGGGGNGSCGAITIADTVTKVVATKYEQNTPCSIGSGAGGSCGTVTIGGTVYPDGITQSPYIYPTYTATLKDGTEDADNWTITPSEGLSESNTVTVAYAGENKVKSVKAKNGTDAIAVTPVTGKTNEWTFQMPDGDVEVEVAYLAVATFDVDGETYAVTTNVVGEAVATPAADPVKAGHSFVGWFTAATGGTQVTDETLMGIADTTFYAQFREPILTIENGVLTAVDFNGCTNLNLVIPTNVTTIGDSAFYQCTGLASVTIPGSVKTISHAAFRDCSNLTSVTIEEGATTIGERAFARCVNLASITIPGTVTEISEAAFSDCKSLTSLTIPGSVKTIGPQAFQNCTGLESVTLEEGVETIRRVAFDGCENLSSVTIPDSVKEIGDDAFAGCSDALYEEGTGNLAGVKLVDGWAVGYDKASISENPDLTGVRGIAGGAFAGCDVITGVIIPDGVATIPEYVFNGCDNLTGVTIPDSVTSIGEGAFGGCDNFASVTIPDSVTSIGKDAFEGCSEELFDTTTLTGVALVDGWAIGYTDALPENLDLTGACGIADNAFRESALESVTIPGTVARVPAGAFMSCTSLASVTLEEGVTAIDDSAFIECSALESVEIPDTVTAIGPQAFVSCAKLASVTVPGSVAEIGPAAFGMCSSLTNVVIEAGVTNIGMMAFAMCSALESLEIPDTVTAIGSQAFMMSMNFASVTIPSSVMEIGQDAFLYTALSTVNVDYGDGERVKAHLAASGLDVSGLTFVEPYKLTFDPDGGEFAEGVETNRFLYAGEEFGDLPEATRIGHTFAGWFTAATNGYEVAATNKMGDADATVYAQWTVNKYTITFDPANDSDVVVITNDYGTVVAAPANPTKTGYTFAGWSPALPATMPAEDTTYTAQWTPNKCTVKFVDENGTVLSSAAYNYGTAASDIAEPATPEKAADKQNVYLFTGWTPAIEDVTADATYTATYAKASIQYLADLFLDEYGKTISLPLVVDGKSVTLFARWALSKYTIKFNANGGKLPTGKTMAAQTIVYGKAAKLRKNVFTKEGYVFAGWATSKANAKKCVIAYKNAQSVKNVRADGGTTTLYAVWAKPKYKVAFYANGGAGATVVQTVKYGKATTLAKCKFVAPKGKKFAGWATSKANAKAGKVKYKNGAAIKGLVASGKTVKLYAVWKKM